MLITVVGNMNYTRPAYAIMHDVHVHGNSFSLIDLLT